MGCEETRRVRDFLGGGLGRDATIAILDHAKTCEDCRAQIANQARFRTAQREGPAATPEPPKRENSCAVVKAPLPKKQVDYQSALRGEFEDPVSYRPRKKSVVTRRMIVIASILAIAMATHFYSQSQKANGGRQWSDLSREEMMASQALADGLPYLEPFQTETSRPVVFSGLIPREFKEVRVVVMALGKIVYDRNHGVDDRSCVFDDAELIAQGDAPILKALAVILPFPSAEELVLTPDTRYFYFLEIPNGNESAPRSLHFKP